MHNTYYKRNNIKFKNRKVRQRRCRRHMVAKTGSEGQNCPITMKS